MSTIRRTIGTPKAPKVPNFAKLSCQKIDITETRKDLLGTYRKPPAMGPQSIPHVNAVDPQAMYDPKFSWLAISAIMLKPKTPTTAPERPWQTRATRSSQALRAEINSIVARAIAMKPETRGTLLARYLSQRYPATAIWFRL